MSTATATMTIPFLLLLLFLAARFSGADHTGDKHHHHHRHSEKEKAPQDLVRSSCAHASYPTVCLRTLSSYSGPADSPRDLAQAAVRVSLSRARRVCAYLSEVADQNRVGSGPTSSKSALSDCVEQVSDSVEELSKTLTELQHLRDETFRWQMSNAETWVSAALTNEDTCLDGFQETGGGGSKVRSDVKRKISNIARVTSNALYMINRLDQTRRRSQSSGRP